MEKKDADKKELTFGIARVNPFARGWVNGAIIVIIYYEFFADCAC